MTENENIREYPNWAMTWDYEPIEEVSEAVDEMNLTEKNE